MNNIIERIWNQGSMVTIEDLSGAAFQAESGGHTFRIRGVDKDGNALTLSGTPSGVMLRADGQDVTLTCSVSGGVVTATLPANAYSVPGRFGITIFLTSDSQKTALYAAIGSVVKTSSGTVAPPAGSDVVDLINQINTAIAAIPVNYNASFAPAYSTSGLYSVGQYVTYDGNLYRCISTISSGESWTSSHWTQVALANEVCDLKSAIAPIINGEDIELKNWRIGRNLWTQNGVLQYTDNLPAYASYPYGVDATYARKRPDIGAVECDDGYMAQIRFAQSNGVNPSVFSTVSIYAGKNRYVIPNEMKEYYFYCSVRKLGDNAEITEQDIAEHVRFISTPYAMMTETAEECLDKISEYNQITPSDTTAYGVLGQNGSIYTQYNTVQIRKYNNLPAGTYYLKGQGTFSVSGSQYYCYAWRVKNGAMVDGVNAVRNPQDFEYKPITVDGDTVDSIWVCGGSGDNLIVLNDATAVDRYARDNYTTKADVALISGHSPIVPTDDTARGVLKTDGTIATNFSTIPIRKYNNLPSRTYYLTGIGTFNIWNQFCYVWRLKNGELVDYIATTTERQIFDSVPITVDGDTVDSIWVCGGSGDNLIVLNDVTAVDRYARDNYATKAEVAEDYATKDEVAQIAEFGIQWKNKVWYCYGTSISNTSNEGKYPIYLEQMSGMSRVNKGISGGGIGNLGAYSQGQVYNAICNTTDGKLNADLITLETGANDVNADVPLGTIYDTGTSTLCGCLNDCIRYLLANTTAQIIIMNSPYGKTMPTETSQVFKWRELMRQICFLNGVHFIDTSCTLGTAKLDSDYGDDYVVDNIHQTNLGAYVFAENIWFQLRNIPIFRTTMPS